MRASILVGVFPLQVLRIMVVSLRTDVSYVEPADPQVFDRYIDIPGTAVIADLALGLCSPGLQFPLFTSIVEHSCEYIDFMRCFRQSPCCRMGAPGTSRGW